MLAKRTKTPTVFSGAIALVALYGCSLQDYDYLGAGNKPPDEPTEEPEPTEGTTDVTTSADASVETVSSETDVTSGTDASVTSEPTETTGSSTSGTEVTSSNPPEPTSEPMSSISSGSSASPTETTVEETSEPPPPPPLVTEGNIITNSSFESALSGWQIIGNATMQTTTVESHTGNRSLIMKNRLQAWEAPGIDVLNLVTEGGIYTARAWVRTNGADGAAFRMQRKARCVIDGGVEGQNEQLAYRSLAQASGVKDEWVQLESAPFTPFSERDCEIVEFVIYFEGPVAGEDIYLDDVSLVPYTL